MPVALQFPRKFKKSAMSDVDEEHSAVAAEDEGRAAEDSEELEGAEKIRVRRKAEWQQVGLWNKEGLSVEDLDARILEVATEQLKPYIPDNLADRHPMDTDLHGWKRKEVYSAHRWTALQRIDVCWLTAATARVCCVLFAISSASSSK